jgi:iron complex outermembrane receptor protein
LRCPTTGDSNDCDTQFPVTFGGNDQLQPQTATQWQVGFMWEPVAGLSIGADYFNIDTENVFVNGLSPAFVLSNLGTYGSLVTRGAVQPEYPNLPGPITDIDQRFVNLGRTQIEGIDVNFLWKSQAWDWGRLQLGLNGSYYMKWDETQPDGSIVGRVGNAYEAANTGVVPLFKQYAALTWPYGPWSATLANSYQSNYVDWGPVGYDAEDNPIKRNVSRLSLWNLSAAYSGFKNWQLVLGVKNLFDIDPPVSNQQVAFQSGYDPSYYDARARFICGTVTYSYR